jgi:hypothetical protein
LIISGERLGGLFRDFRHSAFRLETLQTYTMASEQPGLDRFLAGQARPEGHNAGWTATVRANIAAGKSMTRVKVVRRPFTDYTRFLFEWAIPGNVEAGEDYRIIDITDRTTELPEQDFWIFDGDAVALLNFEPDGTLRDRELVSPSELNTYLSWQKLALSESVPFVDYRT